MITEDYVSFETAKLLKEKGFDAKCRYVYLDTGMRVAAQIFMEGESSVNNDDIESVVKYNDWITYTQGDYAFLCPTIHTAMKWLRELHKIHIEVRITNHSISELVNVPRYYWILFDAEKVKWIDESTAHRPMSFKNYEEACEEAIKYCLENLV